MDTALSASKEPEIRSTPSGVPTATDLGSGLADFLFFPFTVGQVMRRYTNAGEQSAALDSVVTNNAPGFLSGFTREVGATVDDVLGSAKTVARSVGGVVGALLPWWLWALLGLALVAYLVAVFRRAP